MFLEKATLLLECLQEIVINSVNNKRSCKFFKFPGLRVASEMGIASSSNNLCTCIVTYVISSKRKKNKYKIPYPTSAKGNWQRAVHSLSDFTSLIDTNPAVALEPTK